MSLLIVSMDNVKQTDKRKCGICGEDRDIPIYLKVGDKIVCTFCREKYVMILSDNDFI